MPAPRPSLPLSVRRIAIASAVLVALSLVPTLGAAMPKHAGCFSWCSFGPTTMHYTGSRSGVALREACFDKCDAYFETGRAEPHDVEHDDMLRCWGQAHSEARAPSADAGHSVRDDSFDGDLFLACLDLLVRRAPARPSRSDWCPIQPFQGHVRPSSRAVET